MERVTEIEVRSYKSAKEFNKDARRMARQGWEVQDVTNQQPRPGVGRVVMLGLFAAVFKPKPILIVTYRRKSREVEPQYAWEKRLYNTRKG